VQELGEIPEFGGCRNLGVFLHGEGEYAIMVRVDGRAGTLAETGAGHALLFVWRTCGGTGNRVW